MSKKFTLGSKERIKHRKAIEELFSRGRSFTVFPFKVFYLFKENDEPLQAGFSASTRNFKKAVDRNRIKRITKEIYRLSKNKLATKLTDDKKQLSLFIVYIDKELPSFHGANEKMQVIINKLIRLVHEKDPEAG